MKATLSRSLPLALLTLCLLCSSALAAEPSAKASYSPSAASVTVSAEHLTADTAYPIVSVQSKTSVLGLASGRTDEDGAMTVTVPVGPLSDGSYTACIFNAADGSLAVSASFSVKAARPEPSGPPAPILPADPEPEVPEEPVVKSFTDVSETAWYADAIQYVAAKGIMIGESETIFAPGDSMTRAMFVQTLYNLAGRPAVSTAPQFEDTTAGSWYADAVVWASTNNIVNGTGNNQFSPNRLISREDLTVMLYRFVGSPAAAGADLSRFGDSADISSYAVDAISWAVASDILHGTNQGMLNPKASATRAETAALLMNFDRTR